jgi:ADP-heptose:LPS heptosyltransferase
MGDHLIAMPLYRRLRADHPDARLVMICNMPANGNPKLVGPASILPVTLFDEYHAYPVGSNGSAIWDTYRLLRRLDLEKLFYVMPERTERQRLRDRWFFRLAGLPVVGLEGMATDTPPPDTPHPSAGEHELDRLARSTSVEVRRTAADLSIELTDAEHRAAATVLGPEHKRTIVISVGTKLDVKDWGADRWSELVARLADVTTVDRLVFIGAPDEFAYSQSVLRHWPRESINACGVLAPRISAAVLARARLYVGHDSGPMHLAAAVDVPIVAIFSSRSPPGRWFPLSACKRVHYTIIECQACGKLRCDDLNKQCIRSITVEQVFESCRELLALRPSSRG